jgi:hypothetical protein
LIYSAIDLDSRSSFSFDKINSIFLLSKRVILFSYNDFASLSFGGRGLQIEGTISSNSPASANSKIMSIPPINYWFINA